MMADPALAAAGLRLALWCFMAFWLWLALGTLLRKLRIPLPLAVAAALSWVGAGLSLHWVVGELIALHMRVPPGFFTIR